MATPLNVSMHELLDDADDCRVADEIHRFGFKIRQTHETRIAKSASILHNIYAHALVGASPCYDDIVRRCDDLDAVIQKHVQSVLCEEQNAIVVHSDFAWPVGIESSCLQVDNDADCCPRGEKYVARPVSAHLDEFEILTDVIDSVLDCGRTTS